MGIEAMSDAVRIAILLCLFGLTFFSNQKSTVRIGYLAAVADLADLDQLYTIDWGSAILEYLYTALYSFTFGEVREMFEF